MNYIEALKALSEGKTVTDCYGTLYRIHNGEFQFKDRYLDNWHKSRQDINCWIKFRYELVIEYNLTFIEAMNEIQKGNKVECEKNPGELVYLDKYDDDVITSTVFGKQTASFDVYEVRAKWRVVEEEE